MNLQSITNFKDLTAYLEERLDWPIDDMQIDELTFEFDAEHDLGLDPATAAKIHSIRQLRQIDGMQPFGIFFVEFDRKQLPVVAMRRILGKLVARKRESANPTDRKTWRQDDLFFVSAYGEDAKRRIDFAHFADDHEKGLPTLRVLGWDADDTSRQVDWVESKLHKCLRWRDGESIDEWRSRWRDAFVLRYKETIDTSKALAVRLAHLAQNIRRRVNSALRIESAEGPLTTLMTAFRQALIHDLEPDDFADMYAQTVAYGLLSARVSRPAGIHKGNIVDMVPITNPFLRELLETFLNIGGRRYSTEKGRIVGVDFDELGVNDVVDTLNDANMEAVLRDFDNRNPTEDPVIHFYQDFFAEYDNIERFKRGVFYTPRPVVSFIVRSVHELLKTEFGLRDGLADSTTWGEMRHRNKGLKLPEFEIVDPKTHKVTTKPIDDDTPFVQILDPATGTGTFLVEVIDLIHKTMTRKWRADGHAAKKIEQLWNDYVPKDLLPRLHGYELMMAPYAIAHMKIGLKLYETGYRFGSDERARIYLTNALELAKPFQMSFDIPALAHEAEEVNAIKRDKRFTVVIGNPPYAGVSVNRGSWITELIDLYRFVDGQPLEERKIWVKNDYVKFLRLSQFLVDRAKRGIVGMITDHSYLDSPTFRGLRNSLHRSFSFARVLNLHGNSKRRETDPEGGTDENVFDITQGVAIGLFIKNGCCSSPTSYADLWGKRSAKYSQLSLGPNLMKCWHDVFPTSPFFLYTPVSSSISDEYASGWLIADIFPLGSNGVQTSRDSLVLAPSREELARRFDWIRKSSVSGSEIREICNVEDKSFWRLDKARQALRADKNWVSRVTRYAYRPFDNCWLYSSPDFVHRLRREVMRHMERANLALCVGRAGLVIEGVWNLVFATKAICDHNLFYRGSSLNSPLYRYERSDELHAGTQNGRPSSSPNLEQRFLYALAHTLDLDFQPEEDIPKGLTAEDIFGYVYAVLHSPGYRSRYAGFLKIDFPRVPLPGNVELFRALARLGDELVALHIVESPRLDTPLATYDGPAKPTVEKLSYNDSTVWLDKAKTRGFRGVPQAVWNFHIGGYQVCEKWLKDRQAKGGKNPRPGRVLTNEDIDHYQRIVVALSETIRIMAEIDEVIEKHGGWPDAFITDPAKLEELKSPKA